MLEKGVFSNCHAVLKSENFGNGVGLLHLNRIFRTFGAGLSSSSTSNSPAPPVQSRLWTTYLKHKCKTVPGSPARLTRCETKEAYCAPPPAALLRFASLVDGDQGVRNGGIFWAARQLSSKPLGWSRKFAMIVAKQVGAQRDAPCPIPGNTRCLEFFSVFASSAA